MTLIARMHDHNDGVGVAARYGARTDSICTLIEGLQGIFCDFITKIAG